VRPIPHSDGDDASGLICEFVPRFAAVIENCVIGAEDAVGDPILAHELPDVLDRIEFRALGRQWDDGDVGRSGDFGEMQAHRSGVAARHDKSGALALLVADRAENVGRGGALVLGRWFWGAEGRAPRRTHRRVILFFWPTLASSANQTSIAAGSMPFWRATSSRIAENF
jgi:hypothetical protein